jgi:peptide/nickel transport system permease protein
LISGRTFGRGFLLILLVVSAIGPILVDTDPARQSLSLALMPPGSRFLLGSDHLGRSELARVLTGARLSLGVAGGAVFFAVSLGGFLGVLAASLGGAVAAAVRLLCDTALALPNFLAVLLVASLFEPGPFGLAAAIGLTIWAEPCRVALLTAEGAAAAPWVQAGRLAGLSRVQIAVKLIAPSLIGPVSSVAGLMFGQAILSVAALGFLGLGLRPPVAEWGAMIVDALPYIDEAPMLLLVPAAAIIVTVTALFLATGPASAVRTIR